MQSTLHCAVLDDKKVRLMLSFQSSFEILFPESTGSVQYSCRKSIVVENLFRAPLSAPAHNPIVSVVGLNYR